MDRLSRLRALTTGGQQEQTPVIQQQPIAAPSGRLSRLQKLQQGQPLVDEIKPPSVTETGTPEQPENIKAQFNDMLDPNTGRDSVFVGAKTQNPYNGLPLDKGVYRVDSSAGTMYTTNKAKADKYRSDPTDINRAEMLGYSQSKSELTPNAQVVVVTDDTGKRLFEEVTDDPSIVIEKYQKQGYKNIAVQTPQQVQVDRLIPTAINFDQLERLGFGTKEQIVQENIQRARQVAQQAQVATQGKDKIGFFENIRREGDVPGRLGDVEAVPGLEETELIKYAIIGDKIKDGKATAQEELDFQKYLGMMEEETLRGKTVPAHIYDVVKRIPKYGIEFFLTKGAYSAAAAPARKALISAVGKEMLKKGVVRAGIKGGEAIAGTAARTALMPHKVAGYVAQERITGNDEPIAKLALKGFGDTYIENLSEVSGNAMSKYAGKLGKGILKAVPAETAIGKLLHAIPEAELTKRITTGLKKLEKVGYNGTIEEYMEERFGGTLRAITGLGSWDDVVPSAEQSLIELGAFSVPAGAVTATNLPSVISDYLRNKQSTQTPKTEPSTPVAVEPEAKTPVQSTPEIQAKVEEKVVENVSGNIPNQQQGNEIEQQKVEEKVVSKPAENVTQKQPWEMTAKEFYKLSQDERFKIFRKSNTLGHKDIIKTALSQGKTVPANVLKDYPELQKKPIKVKHFTYAENIPSIIKEGFKSDKSPIFGVGGHEGGAKTKKFGKDVLYFTRDDERWKEAIIHVGEGKGDITRPAYDYDNQQWIEEKNAYKKVSLSALEASIKPEAKILTINNLQSADKAIEGSAIYDGYNHTEAIIKYAKDKGYDVVNINNTGNWKADTTDKYGEYDRYEQYTGAGGKDDFFVLNKNIIELPKTSQSATIPPMAEKQAAREIEPSKQTQVVDEKGNPLTVYHGTTAEFAEFDNANIGKSTDTGMWGSGFYFTNDLKYAKTYTKGKGRVVEANINLQNPYVIKSKADIPQITTPDKTIEDLKNADKNYSKAFTKYLQDRGYDGVIFEQGNYKEYVVFDAKQITQLQSSFNQSAPEDGGKNAQGEKAEQKAGLQGSVEIEPTERIKSLEQIRKEGETPADTILKMPTDKEVEAFFDIEGEKPETLNNFVMYEIKKLGESRKIDIPKTFGQIKGWVKAFADSVPEFTLNPKFKFDKNKGTLVFRDGYKYNIYPSNFGLDIEQLKDGQTVGFDLESFGIKIASEKKLETAKAFLAEKAMPKQRPAKGVPNYGLSPKTGTARSADEIFQAIEDTIKARKPKSAIKSAVNDLLGVIPEREYGVASRIASEINGKYDTEGYANLLSYLNTQRKYYSKQTEESAKSGGSTLGDPVLGATNEIDRGRISVSLEPGGKPMSAREIVDYVSRAFNVVMRGKATHKMRNALGWYDPKAVGIRLKDVRSLTTAMHEIGHFIDRQLNGRLSKNPPSTAIADELMAMGQALYGSIKPNGGYKSEGWAEFIRAFTTGEDTAKLAPATHKWFTDEYLANHPETAKKINTVRAMIDKWRLQGAEARIDSQISTAKIHGSLGERLEKAMLWVDTNFRDEAAPIRVGMKKAGIKEGELAPDENPYQIYVARADKAGAVAQQFVLEYTTDLSGNRTGEGLREIIKPVRGDIRAFTRWIIAVRARLLLSRGINPGISQMDADYVYEKYKKELWQKVLDDLTAWNHRVLDYLIEAGGMSEEAGKRIKELNPVYIPFLRAFKEGELHSGGGIGKGIAKAGKAVKAIKGSGREIIDPLESMITQTEKIIGTAHKAEVAKALVKLANRPGMASLIWKVPAPQQATRFEAEQLKKDIVRIAYKRLGLDPSEISSGMLERWDEELTVFSNASHYYGKDNIISLYVDGQQQFYEVNPDLYRALEGLDQYHLPWIIDFVFGKANRMVRLGATGLNAGFGLIRNFIRDAMTFTVLSKHAKLGPVTAISGVIKDVVNTEGAKKFKSLGGKMSVQILADRRAAQHLKKHVLASTIGGKTIYTVAHPVDAIRELFGVTEAGTRIGEFDAALKYAEEKWGKGSKSAAIYALNQAQDVTTNFTRHGRIAKVLNQMIPFFNAAIQGVDKIGRTFKERPVATTLKAMFTLTLPAIWFWWKYKDEEWYKNMPDYERVNYLHFEIPGSDKVIRIPVPFELGHVFQSAPVAALDAQYRKNAQAVKDMFAEVLKQANPFDWPAAISPIIDILKNKNFAGVPIVSKGVEYKLPEDQYNKHTTELMKLIGKTIDYSPAKLEYLVNAYSGGLFQRVARTVDLKNKDDIGPEDWPVVSTLFLKEPYAPKKQVEQFYERRDLLSQKGASDKVTNAEDKERKQYNQASKDMTKLWKDLDAAKTENARKAIYNKMRGIINPQNIRRRPTRESKE